MPQPVGLVKFLCVDVYLRSGKGHLTRRQFIKMDRLRPASNPPLFSLDSTFRSALLEKVSVINENVSTF